MLLSLGAALLLFNCFSFVVLTLLTGLGLTFVQLDLGSFFGSGFASFAG